MIRFPIKMHSEARTRGLGSGVIRVGIIHTRRLVYEPLQLCPASLTRVNFPVTAVTDWLPATTRQRLPAPHSRNFQRYVDSVNTGGEVGGGNLCIYGGFIHEPSCGEFDCRLFFMLPLSRAATNTVENCIPVCA